MASVMVVRRRRIAEEGSDPIRGLLAWHTDWNRARLSRELCANRNAWLGWDRHTRERNPHSLTDNMLFLIPDWVQVPRQVGHLLGLIV